MAASLWTPQEGGMTSNVKGCRNKCPGITAQTAYLLRYKSRQVQCSPLSLFTCQRTTLPEGASDPKYCANYNTTVEHVKICSLITMCHLEQTSKQVVQLSRRWGYTHTDMHNLNTRMIDKKCSEHNCHADPIRLSASIRTPYRSKQILQK